MAYRLSAKAERDVFNIFVDSAREFGIAQADKYHGGLRGVFEFLAENPRAVRLRKEFVPPVGIHAYGAHVVIFSLKGDDVRIVRVLHGQQDWARWL